MIDEYTDNRRNGANKSAQSADINQDFSTSNYPPPNDSTSSGGYGSATNPFSDASQRGYPEKDSAPNGLIDQSTASGGPIGRELEDAKQGQDEVSRREFAHQAGRDFASGSEALNPYGLASVESRKDAGEMLASRYADRRGQQYESGSTQGNDSDVGAAI